MQRVQHLKIFERLTQLYYRKRKYVCRCGKRFVKKTFCRAL
nr:transposase family protein [Anaerobacillus alkalilacustris]